ncbi:unnamed protein product [Toxocara canis]|uniref:BAG domain-containing protein n=1 Tax=Toxocara canis TaxID=6265 RepID=A0A183TVK3_TOXCA|nr:unnamed protein product [Toxocara canis]
MTMRKKFAFPNTAAILTPSIRQDHIMRCSNRVLPSKNIETMAGKQNDQGNLSEQKKTATKEKGGSRSGRSSHENNAGQIDRSKEGSASEGRKMITGENAQEKWPKRKTTVVGVNKRTFVSPSFGPFIEFWFKHLDRPLQGQMTGDFMAFSANTMAFERARRADLDKAMACGASKGALSYRHNFTVNHSFVLPHNASLPLQVGTESQEADVQRLSALLDATYVEAKSIVTPLVMKKENISVTDLRRLAHAISEQIRIDEASFMFQNQIMETLNCLRSIDVISMGEVSKLRNALLDRLASRRSATLSVYDLQKAVTDERKL